MARCRCARRANRSDARLCRAGRGRRLAEVERDLVDVLEPTLQALEKRLQASIEHGLIIECDTRHAALALVSPLLLALLHQHDLGGTRCRPLSVPNLIDEQVNMFARAYRKDVAGG